MANRRNQPPYRPGRPPRRSGGSSPTSLIIATTALIIVAAAVGFLAFGSRHSPNSSTTAATPLATPATPLALGITPAATAVETPAANPTATETAVSTAEPTVEPTAKPTATTQAKTAVPTETAAPTSAPTAAATNPALGAFGELPPADVPTGNSAGRQMQLDYRLNMSLQQVPQNAPVYQLQPRKWTADNVGQLAKSLGITGKVTDEGGTFHASGGSGDLYVSASLVQYIAATDSAAPSSGSLPSDSAAIDAARSWLLKHDLVGSNVGAGEVVGREESAGKVQVRVKPADPSSILSATPSATLTIGRGGGVLEADCRWPTSFQSSSYGLSSADQLWSDAKSGQGYVEVDPSALPSGSLTGTATMTSASVAYTIAGQPGGVQYLVPLVVFQGQATFQGASNPVPIKVYVPAVSGQAAPRG